MSSCASFEDYSYIEAAPLPLQEQPMPQPFRCPYAQDEELCITYAPLHERDLRRQFLALRTQPGVRCLLLALPDEAAQGPFPIEAIHLAHWCKSYQEGLPFHLQPLRTGRRYPCGDEPACRLSPQVRERETAQTLARTAAVTQQLDSQIRELFPGLEGARKKERNFDLLHAWATQEDPDDSSKPISIPTLAKKFNLKDRKTVYNILHEAERINPRVYAQLEKVRTDRARITRGGEVRQV